MRVAFTLIGGGKGTGGYNYLLNLLRVLCLHEASRVAPVLLLGTDVALDEAAPFEAGLAKIFGLIHEFLAPQMRIGGVQIQWETARTIDNEASQHGCENEPTHVLIPPLVTYPDSVASTTPCTRENIGCSGCGT